MNNRYTLYQFDCNTYVVMDDNCKREICVCSNYDNYEDAFDRATILVALLNQEEASNKAI